MKAVVTRFTTDSVPRWRPLTRDEVLEANKAHKSIASGLVYSGDIKPKLDLLIEQAEKLHGFMVNHVVGPEPSQVIDQMLGRVWRGVSDLRSELKRASVADDDLIDPVDTSEALGAVEQLRQTLGTEQISMSAFNDSIKSLKRALDAVDRRGSNRGTNDAQWGRGWISRSMSATRSAIAKFNGRPSAVSASTTRDSQTEIRDRLHAVSKATSTPEQVRAIGDVHKAFWAERRYTPPTNDGRTPVLHVDAGQSSPKTPAEMNERNRQFWAARE